MKNIFVGALVSALLFISCQKEQLQSATITNQAVDNNNTNGLTYDATTSRYTLSLQPGSKLGDDLWMKHWDGHPAYADTNDTKVALIKGLAYDLAKSLVLTRSVIRFDSIAKVPTTATVLNATLYLYGPTSDSKDVSVHLPMGNTSYPGSTKGDNTCLLQRITSNWNVNTICWNNPPGTTTNNQLVIGPSDKQWQWDVALNVTDLVKPMVSNPANNNGFLLRLKTEIKPRAMGFLSSNSPEADRRPKLVITFTK